MNRGGKRENAGRKSKAEEMKLPLLMQEVITEDDWIEIFKAIVTDAKAGSFQHQKLLFEYRFGKPTQMIIGVEVEATNKKPSWFDVVCDEDLETNL